MIMGEAPICLSGGAEGADSQWGVCAGMAGHLVYHFSFQGHRTNVPPSEVVVLTPEQLAQADPALEVANQTLKRSVPYGKPWIANLLRRNWFQVRDAQSVYAVSTLKGGMVEGGTAWATQMFIDRHAGQACPAYLYDQAEQGWKVWNGAWEALETPPVPTGIWAGIGSRALGLPGKQAIRTLLGYVPPSFSI